MYSKDIEFDKVGDDRETEIMNVGWQILNFHHQIPIDEQKTVAKCIVCQAFVRKIVLVLFLWP